MPISYKREGGANLLLPDGIYRVVIEAADEKPGPSGYNYINFRLRPIVNGQKAKQAIWDKISLSPEARFRVEAFLDAVGAPEEGSGDAKSFVGKSYWASVKSREYQGQWSNEIKQYLTPEAAESLAERSAQQGDDSFGSGISQERRTRPVEQAPVRKKRGQAQAVAELSEDDSPF